MEYLIMGTPDGYAVKLDGRAIADNFCSETELREYLRNMGVPERKIDVAIRCVNFASDLDREFRVFA